MAEILGVNILSTIVPYTDADTYATHDDKYGKGGWRSVEHYSDLSLITQDRLKVGMAVHVIEQDLTYIYKSRVEGESIVYYWEPSTVPVKIKQSDRDVSTNGKAYVKDPSSGEYVVYDASNGDFFVYNDTSSGVIYGKTAYISDGTNWIALSGNVDAKNVWFPSGVQRTEKWGAATTENPEPTPECVGYNLVDLLENYLVKEKWPTVQYSEGTTSIENNYALTLTAPNTINQLIPTLPTSNATVDVGTTYAFAKYEYTPDTSTTGETASYVLGPNKIYGMTFGYWDNEASAIACDLDPEHYSKDTSIATTTKTANATYTNNIDDAVNILSITKTGFTTTAGVDTSINVTGNSKITIPANTYTVTEGTNTVTRKYSTDASLSKALDQTSYSIPKIDKVWYASNKHKGYADKTAEHAVNTLTAASLIPSGQRTKHITVADSTSVTITGAWKVYTNASKTSATDLWSEYTEPTAAFKGNDASIAYAFCPSSLTFYLRWPILSVQAGAEEYAYIYVPNSKKISYYGVVDPLVQGGYISKTIPTPSSVQMTNDAGATGTFKKYRIPTDEGALTTIKIVVSNA